MAGEQQQQRRGIRIAQRLGGDGGKRRLGRGQTLALPAGEAAAAGQVDAMHRGVRRKFGDQAGDQRRPPARPGGERRDPLAQPLQGGADQVQRNLRPAIVEAAGDAARQPGMHAETADADAMQAVLGEQFARGGLQVARLVVAFPLACRPAFLVLFGGVAGVPHVRVMFQIGCTWQACFFGDRPLACASGCGPLAARARVYTQCGYRRTEQPAPDTHRS
jgi:hypothetical protein